MLIISQSGRVWTALKGPAGMHGRLERQIVILAIHDLQNSGTLCRVQCLVFKVLTLTERPTNQPMDQTNSWLNQLPSSLSCKDINQINRKLSKHIKRSEWKKCFRKDARCEVLIVLGPLCSHMINDKPCLGGKKRTCYFEAKWSHSIAVNLCDRFPQAFRIIGHWRTCHLTLTDLLILSILLIWLIFSVTPRHFPFFP